MSTKSCSDKSPAPETKNAVLDVDAEQRPDDGEVFRTDVEGQNYRTVSWSVLPVCTRGH